MKRMPLLDLLLQAGHPREKAHALILAGRVLVDGTRETRTGIQVAADCEIRIVEGKQYVSRAAYKLEEAFETFQPTIQDRICVDLGASHGGFTQLLLEKGALRVYAVDVAYGILDYKLRRDHRVVVLERHNARNLVPEWVQKEDRIRPEGLAVTCDVSFISMKSILPPLAELARDITGPLDGLMLVKPQFEASRETEEGILRDEEVTTRVLDEVRACARELGFQVPGIAPASITGTKGNQEYVMCLRFEE